jgi:hypothetical protein
MGEDDNPIGRSVDALDGEAAADELAALRAEVERLRVELERLREVERTYNELVNRAFPPLQ